MRALGEFEVELQPLESYAEGDDSAKFGRFSIDKSFVGDLLATSKGEMLSVMTAKEGSAGYVAIEQVSGSLSGKNGKFVLQHFGIMNQERNRLILEVVPDSGSGQLKGLVGEMQIRIEDGKHYYEFEYELPM